MKVVVYLRPPAGSFLCMFWMALLAERTAFSGRLVSSAVGRRPLRGFKNLKRLITAHSARFTHVLGGRCGFMGNTVRMRIPGIYCGSIFAWVLAINRPTQIFRHLRYLTIQLSLREPDLHHPLTHSLTHPLTHSLTHPLSQSLTHPPTYPPPPSLAHSLTHCLTCSHSLHTVTYITPTFQAGSWAGNLMLTHDHDDFPSDVFVIMAAVGATLSIG